MKTRILIITYVLSIIASIYASFISAYFLPNASLVQTYFLVNLPHITQIFTIFILLYYLTKENIFTLFKNFDFYSLSCLVITLLVLLVFSLINSDSIYYNKTEINTRIFMFISVLVITGLQAINEEFVFRILPYRILKFNNNYILPIISGLFFSLLHMANPEALEQNKFIFFLYFFSFGFFSMHLGLKLNNFIPSIVLHATINFYLTLFVGYENSALIATPFFMLKKTPDVFLSLIQVLTIFLLIYFVIYLRRNKKWQKRKEE